MGALTRVTTDDRRLMGWLSGYLWLLAAGVGALGQAVAPAPPGHRPVVWALVAVAALYGLACVREWIPWARLPLRAHAAAILLAQPLVGTAIWVTGGAGSYMAPTLVLAMLYLGYFFPPRLAWPLWAVEVLVAVSPVAYEGGTVPENAARGVAWTGTSAGLLVLIGFLKARMQDAEALQRDMAHRDPLTGVPNRRAFDDALAAATSRGRPFALVVLDVDGFKQINDTYGHLTGDRVLRELAAHATARLREDDLLARIGGDEFAVVAPAKDAVAARRLVAALHEAAAVVRPSATSGPISVTVATATSSEHGTAGAELRRTADQRLHEAKRTRRTAQHAAGPALG